MTFEELRLRLNKMRTWLAIYERTKKSSKRLFGEMKQTNGREHFNKGYIMAIKDVQSVLFEYYNSRDLP